LGIIYTDILVQKFLISILNLGTSCYDEKSLYNKKSTVIEVTQSLNLFGILKARDGSIWIGASDGVYRYDGKTVKRL
jgi:ligand-binding sensor domain-containing protein